MERDESGAVPDNSSSSDGAQWVEPPENPGKSVTISWDGSLEASRAVAMNRPILRAAEQVTIPSSGGEPAAATAEELVAYLAAHGITVGIHRFEDRDNPDPAAAVQVHTR